LLLRNGSARLPQVLEAQEHREHPFELSGAPRNALTAHLVMPGGQPHHPPLGQRFAKGGPAPENPTPVQAMAHRLKTPEGREL